MSKALSLDLQIIGSIIDSEVNRVQHTMNSTIESLLKQIEPDEKNDDGSFTLYFDSREEQVFWNPSNEDDDASELRHINIFFLEPNKYRKEPVMDFDFGFVGNDDFETDIDSLRIETKKDLINVLLYRLNDQRQAKRKRTKKKA